MTEQEWMEAKNPTPMLELLRGKASERKLRLFAVSCARRLWGAVESWYHTLAEVAEQYADDEATEIELQAAKEVAYDPDWAAGLAFEDAAFLGTDPFESAGHAARMATRAFADLSTGYPGDPPNDTMWLDALHRERATQAELLRDLIGNPFHPTTLEPIWLTSTVTDLAASGYEMRLMPAGELDPARLAVLSDALEEAGCTDAAILDHLRSPGPHVRGCWALDLILGKQ